MDFLRHKLSLSRSRLCLGISEMFVNYTFTSGSAKSFGTFVYISNIRAYKPFCNQKQCSILNIREILVCFCLVESLQVYTAILPLCRVPCSCKKSLLNILEVVSLFFLAQVVRYTLTTSDQRLSILIHIELNNLGLYVNFEDAVMHKRLIVTYELEMVFSFIAFITRLFRKLKNSDSKIFVKHFRSGLIIFSSTSCAVHSNMSDIKRFSAVNFNVTCFRQRYYIIVMWSCF